MSEPKGPTGLFTKLIQIGEGADPLARPLTTPVYETTTFVFESAAEVEAYAEGRSSRYLYSRYSNPSIAAVEAKLAAVEGAEAGLVFSSGMAATTTILQTLLSAGDEVICPSGVYGGTLHLLQDVLQRFGVRTRFVSQDDLRRVEGVCGPSTKLVWFESPVNPTLHCVDIASVAKGCRARGVLTVFDNTFASPVNQRPLDLGVDLVMHSATKYLNGHSDVTAGAVVGPATLVGRVERTRRLLGTMLDPLAAVSLAKGLKTLPLRVERHNRNAAAVAAFLEGHPRVTQVLYPGLPSHPDHDIAVRQMRGFGGMVCVEVAGGYAGVCRFFDRLRVFRRAASLGGVESLCSLPVLTSQFGYTDEQLAMAGVTRGMARLSVGLEDPDDLVADLQQALE